LVEVGASQRSANARVSSMHARPSAGSKSTSPSSAEPMSGASADSHARVWAMMQSSGLAPGHPHAAVPRQSASTCSSQ
jgi:hypothetical protein